MVVSAAAGPGVANHPIPLVRASGHLLRAQAEHGLADRIYSGARETSGSSRVSRSKEHSTVTGAAAVQQLLGADAFIGTGWRHRLGRWRPPSARVSGLEQDTFSTTATPTDSNYHLSYQLGLYAQGTWPPQSLSRLARGPAEAGRPPHGRLTTTIGSRRARLACGTGCHEEPLAIAGRGRRSRRGGESARRARARCGARRRRSRGARDGVRSLASAGARAGAAACSPIPRPPRTSCRTCSRRSRARSGDSGATPIWRRSCSASRSSGCGIIGAPRSVVGRRSSGCARSTARPDRSRAGRLPAATRRAAGGGARRAAVAAAGGVRAVRGRGADSVQAARDRGRARGDHSHAAVSRASPAA